MSFAHNARGFKIPTILKGKSRRGSTYVPAKQSWDRARRALSQNMGSNAILSTDPDFVNGNGDAFSNARTFDRAARSPAITVLKDNFVTSKLPTTCASLILEGFKGPQDSTVGHILSEAQISVIAKTNMDEFGMGSHSINSAYGRVRNGTHQAQSAGGSSGGSAMAVADNLVRIAIGSDTGGSVRLPAAYTGTVGFKPSYGRISRNGLVPYANSLDTVGIIADNVTDVTVMFKILDQPDPADPTCQTYNTRERIRQSFLKQKLKPRSANNYSEKPRVRTIPNVGDDQMPLHLKEEKFPDLEQATTRVARTIGVPNEYNIKEMHPLVKQAWIRTLSMLASRGYNIKLISLPTTQQALAAYYVLAPAEASSNLAKCDGVRYGAPRAQDLPDNHNGPLYSQYRGALFGDEVKRRILLGTFSLSAGAMDNYFIQAQKVRRLVQQDFNNVFTLQHPLMDGPPSNSSPTFNGMATNTHAKNQTVDFILVPTAPTLPPLISKVEAQQSPLDSYINDVFTVPASLAGLPAVSIPVIANDESIHTPDRNIGLQVIGQFGDDRAVLSFARNEIEAYMPFDERYGNAILKQTRL